MMKKAENNLALREQKRVDTVKDYLSQIILWNQVVENCDCEVQAIREKKYSLCSPRLSGGGSGRPQSSRGLDGKLAGLITAEQKALAKLKKMSERRDRFVKEVNTALESIPDEKARESLRLAYFEDMSAADIGKVYGVDGRTVRRWKSKACLLFPLPPDWERKLAVELEKIPDGNEAA